MVEKREALVLLMARSMTVVALGCAPAAPGGVYYATGEGSVAPDGLHLLEWEPY